MLMLPDSNHTHFEASQAPPARVRSDVRRRQRRLHSPSRKRFKTKRHAFKNARTSRSPRGVRSGVAESPRSRAESPAFGGLLRGPGGAQEAQKSSSGESEEIPKPKKSNQKRPFVVLDLRVDPVLANMRPQDAPKMAPRRAPKASEGKTAANRQISVLPW